MKKKKSILRRLIPWLITLAALALRRNGLKPAKKTKAS